jgi:glycosyltransferase involved in cell wall biosynthesis
MTVAWISQFPIEWLPDVPEHLRSLPRQHPATWQRVLLAEMERNPDIRLHIVILRKQFARSESFQRNGVTFHLVKAPGSVRAPSLFWVDTLLIRKVLRRIQPDLVHAWGTENGAALVASRLGYRYVVTMQGLLSWLAETTRLNAYHRLSAWLEPSSLRRARVVTAESRFAVDYLGRRYPHLELHQVEHAPLPLFHEMVRRPQRAPVRLLFVGSVGQGKGADVLLRALDTLPGGDVAWELVLIGEQDGELVESLRRQTRAELWERIQFLGTRTSPEVAMEMSRATMLVYPTRCDNSPNAVKEAVVAGLPVVASRVGGIVDYVWPGRNGVLFAAGDVVDCQRALREALADRRFSAGEVEPAALNEVRSYLSAEVMARRFCDVYWRAAGRSGSGSGRKEGKNTGCSSPRVG